jgi:hypothetical protein
MYGVNGLGILNAIQESMGGIVIHVVHVGHFTMIPVAVERASMHFKSF